MTGLLPAAPPDLTAMSHDEFVPLITAANLTTDFAVALSALMRSETNRVERKLRGLVTVAESLLDEARQLLLATVVDRYLPLSDDEMGLTQDEA